MLSTERIAIQLEPNTIEATRVIALVERRVELETDFLSSHDVHAPFEPLSLLDIGAMGLNENAVAYSACEFWRN